MDEQNITPRFPFGFGLSYTTFSYGALSIVASSSPTAYIITFTVTNSGSVMGTEIPQLYLGFPQGCGAPKRVLRGFEEVLDLDVGEGRRVEMKLSEREIRFVVISSYPSTMMSITSLAVSGMSWRRNGRGRLGNTRSQSARLSTT
jgi:Fibronectin type III-like domain